MSSYTLNIKVEGGELSADRSILTADSVEYIVAAFTFDESWNNLYKTAIFRVGELVYHVPLENGACNIPFEALKEPIMHLSVFGVLNTTRATTTELPIQIKNSGYVVCEPQAPAADPYNYFIERVTEIKEEAIEQANFCVSAAESAESSKNIAISAVAQTNEAKESTLESSKNASQSAAEARSALEEIRYHKGVLTELSNEVQITAGNVADAAESIETSVLTGVENHNCEENALAHPNIMRVANEAKTIALGKANSLCFDTENQLIDWVAGRFERTDGKTVSELKTGDNLYILELGVPDYWWDGSAIQPLGAEKPDFSDYYTKSQIDSRISNASFELIGRSEYNALYGQGGLEAGRIYFVFEEE